MKKFLFMLLILFIPLSVNAESILAPSAKSVIVMEPTTGEIIYERNAHEKLHPASMTKIMTMLLTVEAVEKDIIKWEDIVTVSANASGMGGSQILLETGEQMSVYDLFKGVAVASGNDASVALAEKIAGSEEIFVGMMNKRATELGLTNTNFKNTHGLDAPNHYSTAYDMAVMSRELLKHDIVIELTSIYEDYLRKGTDRPFWLVNTNKLVRYYKGVDGLKTGYTASAGFCISATAKVNDMRIITVVMGEPDSKTRNSEVSSVFDYIYAQYGINKIIEKNTIVETINIERSVLDKVDIVPIEDVSTLYKKTDGKGEYTYDISINSLKAPLTKGKVVGELSLKKDNQIIKKINLTVKEDVKKANFFQLYYKYLKKIIAID